MSTEHELWQELRAERDLALRERADAYIAVERALRSEAEARADLARALEALGEMVDNAVDTATHRCHYCHHEMIHTQECLVRRAAELSSGIETPEPQR